MKRSHLSIFSLIISVSILGNTNEIDTEPAEPDAIRALEPKAFEIPGSSKFFKIKMLKIPAGSFTMGSPKNEAGRGDDEAEHPVTITRSFYMAETPITHSQYLPVMVPNYQPMFVGVAGYGHSLPELHDGGPFFSSEGKYFGIRDNAPMDGITWQKAVEFCKKLTDSERSAGRLPDGYIYRLPTEAEWEYACRAGTQTAFNNERAATEMSGTRIPPFGMPHIVKIGKQVNTCGLFDMHASIYEWCLDDYAPYDLQQKDDPLTTTNGPGKVARGGSNKSKAKTGKGKTVMDNVADRIRYTRSASRNHFPADFPLPIVGMRVVLAPEL
jgi:formylglycine-generating enzyme required for sulfatase activity